MSRLTMSLLGTFETLLDGESVAGFESDKGRALLAYLVVESNRPHRRDALASLLWPNADDQASRSNLRQTLHKLRSVLGDQREETPRIDGDRNAVQYHAATADVVDALEFRSLIASCQAHPHRELTSCVECMQRCTRAVHLYRGDFLAGLTLPDSQEFDDWVTMERESLHNQALVAFHGLVSFHLRRREYFEAARFCRRLLDLEPWHEEAHRELMRALALSGQRSAAIAQFESCRALLRREFDTEPTASTVDLYQQILADSVRPSPAPGSNPYLGLKNFTEQDSSLFYGRELFISQLSDAIRSRSIVAILGPSGSGKSSAVLAGLLPALRPSGAWSIRVFRPGEKPVARLAEALAQLAGTGAESSVIAAALRTGDETPASVAMSLVAARPQVQHVLLVVDQFEEVFTFCTRPEERARFIELLLCAAGSPSIPLRVIVCLRADFLAQAMEYRPLSDILQSNAMLLGPMTRQELLSAIEEPARNQGVTFEPGLTDRIIADLGSTPANLPLLEFTLTMLWEERDGDLLTHAAYDRLGGVEGSLVRYADRVIAQMPEEDRELARRVLVNLVRPGEGTADTRRSASQVELTAEEWAMARRLADARLTVTSAGEDGNQRVEIVHDALIELWAQLRLWMDTTREMRSWETRIRGAQQLWEANGHDEDLLMRGPLLSHAEEWLRRLAPTAQPEVRAYVDRSIKQREAQQHKEEAARLLELKQARALASSERSRAEVQAKSAQKLRRVLATMAVLFLMAVGASVAAFIEGQESDRQARIALEAESAAVAARHQAEQEQFNAESERQRAESEAARAEMHRLQAEERQAYAESQAQLALSRQLGAQGLTRLSTRPDLGILLGIEALRLTDSERDRSSLILGTELTPRLSRYLHGHEREVFYLGFAPDGSALISGGPDGLLIEWDPASGEMRNQSIIEPDLQGRAMSADGNTIAVVMPGGFGLWDRTSGEQIGNEISMTEEIRSMTFSPSGEVLITGSVTGELSVWSVTPTGATPLSPYGARVWDGSIIALSPDGKTLAATDHFDVTLWDLATGQQIAPPLQGHTAEVHTLAFSRDGSTLATASFDETAMLWDVATGKRIGEPLAGHGGRVLNVAFSPDGRTLATGSTDNSIILWDVATQHPLGKPLKGHTNWVQCLRFSPDGLTLASGDGDGHLILWDVRGRNPYTGFTAQARPIVFTPDGKTMVGGGLDGRIVFWDLEQDGGEGEIVQANQGWVVSLAMSPDGKYVASTADGQQAAIYDTASRSLVTPLLQGHTGMVLAVAFNGDGTLLATGSADMTARIWDTSTHQQVGPALTGHEAMVLAVAFSADSKTLITGAADRSIRFWDIATGKQIGDPIAAHSNWVTALDVSPDGAILASGSSDHAVRLWDLSAPLRTTGQPVDALTDPLDGHQGVVWKVAFNRADGGKTLLSGSDDGEAIWWSIPDGEPVGPPLMTGGQTEGMALSPDAEWLAVSSLDTTGGTVSIWATHLEPWTERGCAIANRNLTADEWREFVDVRPYEKTCPGLP